MRVAIAGYGAVAGVHARGLRGNPQVTLSSVYGPDVSKASAFAAEHEAERADSDFEAALQDAQAVLICSPSPIHFEQALKAISAGLHALVELPPCLSDQQGRDLIEAADRNQVTLQCAHTSRFLDPYRKVGDWLPQLGEILHVRYTRSIPPRNRSWIDDALWHHAAHPLDLFLQWFGPIRMLGCSAHPQDPGAQDLSLLAETLAGAPISISISYTTRIADVEMVVTGSQHSVITDGFTFIDSDLEEFRWNGDGQEAYESAVQEQDRQFLQSCWSGAGGTPWHDTLRMLEGLEEFSNLWRNR